MLLKGILQPATMIAASCRKTASCHIQQQRTFYRMLNAVFNRPDRDRIQEVGAERACAEWLMRCGAGVRWRGSDHWQKDYNALPPAAAHRHVIEEVDADEAAVMDIGFEHFKGCDHITRVRFHHCPYFEDSALVELRYLRESLEHLELGSLGDVTDGGLASLGQLHRLQTLRLYDLPAVVDRRGTYSRLCKALPACDINYADLDKT